MAATENVRAEVARRARYRCEYCGYPEAASSTPLEVDHIVPRARGGSATFDNLALCCRRCNLYKHVQTEAVDPVSAVTRRLFNPRTQQLSKYFWLDRDTSALRGLTPIVLSRVSAVSVKSADVLATLRC